MDHTLTVTLPFIILGRKQVLDLSTLTSAEQRTRPISLTHALVKEICPDIDIELDVQENDSNEPSVTPYGSNAPLPVGGTSSKRNSVISPGLRFAGLSSPALAFTDPRVPTHQRPTWTMAPATHSLSLYEHSLLPRSIWECPIVLQRRGISLDTSQGVWADFCLELSNILYAFTRFNNSEGEIKGRDVWGYDISKGMSWNIVAGVECWSRVELQGSDEEGLRLGDAKKILMMFTGVERDVMPLISSPAGLIKFLPMSRTLERYAVRKMRSLKKEVAMSLTEKGMSEMRIARSCADEKQKWILEWDEKRDKMLATRARKREWWDMLDDMEGDSMEELVQYLGKRDCTTQVELLIKDEDSSSQKNMDDTEAPTSNEDDGHKDGDKPEQQNAHEPPKIASLTINGLKPTLDTYETMSQLDLIATLFHTALASDFSEVSTKHSTLTAFLEALCSSRRCAPSTPRDSTIANPNVKFQPHNISNTTHLLSLLPMTIGSRNHLLNNMSNPAKPYSQTLLDASKATEASKRPDASTNPFYDLVIHLKEKEGEEREEMARFMQRYEEVGGWEVSCGEKLGRLGAREGMERERVRIEGEGGLREGMLEGAVGGL